MISDTPAPVVEVASEEVFKLPMSTIAAYDEIGIIPSQNGNINTNMGLALLVLEAVEAL